MRTLLNLTCWASVAACSWLAAMFVVLHRPGFERGLSFAVFFVLQSLLVLAISSGIASAPAWRRAALVGACGIVVSGGGAVANTLNSNHFEGFVLIIGTLLVLQGALTIPKLITAGFTTSSKVHHFGK